MKRHILLIDPLEKLNTKKDSSLMLALGLKAHGSPVFVMFPEQLYFSNGGKNPLKVFEVSGEFETQGFYLKHFQLGQQQTLQPGPADTIHMRLDPPFDSRYLRYTWLLRSLKSKYGVQVLNSPEGILQFNEKLLAYESDYAVESFVGEGLDEFLGFCKRMQDQGKNHMILKPLDLYQGMGVEKFALDVGTSALSEMFKLRVQQFQGPVVCQPFLIQVHDGEVRAVYFQGKELGSILKVPPKGQFLANIAQGASYQPHQLSSTQRKHCEHIVSDLAKVGVDWVAFDILGDYISEVNITCPGLIVEVSSAHQRNLAMIMAQALHAKA